MPSKRERNATFVVIVARVVPTKKLFPDRNEIPFVDFIFAFRYPFRTLKVHMTNTLVQLN